MSKTVNFPNNNTQNAQAEKTKQALDTLAALQGVSRTVPIPADLYTELVEAKTTLAILVRACDGKQDYELGGIVRAILNVAEPPKASGGNEEC